MNVYGDMAESGALENNDNSPPVDGIFAAECILKKRTRKVRIFGCRTRYRFDNVLLAKCFTNCEFLSVSLTGKDRVFGEVERLVTEVSKFCVEEKIILLPQN